MTNLIMVLIHVTDKSISCVCVISTQGTELVAVRINQTNLLRKAETNLMKKKTETYKLPLLNSEF